MMANEGISASILVSRGDVLMLGSKITPGNYFLMLKDLCRCRYKNDRYAVFVAADRWSCQLMTRDISEQLGVDDSSN